MLLNRDELVVNPVLNVLGPYSNTIDLPLSSTGTTSESIRPPRRNELSYIVTFLQLGRNAARKAAVRPVIPPPIIATSKEAGEDSVCIESTLAEEFLYCHCDDRIGLCILDIASFETLDGGISVIV